MLRNNLGTATLIVIVAMSWLGSTVMALELRRTGYLGVISVPLTDEVKKQLGPGETGILVQRVLDDGSAAAVGLRSGDVVTEVNEHKIVDVNDFIQTARGLRAGDTATIRFRRDGGIVTKSVSVKPRPLESAPDVDTLYRVVTVDDSLRRVIITVPKTPGKHPGVLYVTGIGCFSQESSDLQSADAKLLYGLSRSGFVTMRVEKSGMGDSEGPPCLSPTVDLQVERRGYLAGLKALKQYAFVDPDNVFIVGISIGGVQAPMIAQQETVKGIVVINTVIKPFLEYLMDTRRRQNTLRKTPYDLMEVKLRDNEKCNHRLLIDLQPPDTIYKDAPECRDYITYPAPFTYMQQWAALNPAAEWKKVTAPVLIVYGTSDFVSTIADDPMMADVINSFHPGNATLKAIPNMEHGMTKAPSMEASANKPAGSASEFEPAILDTIREWLLQKVKTVNYRPL